MATGPDPCFTEFSAANVCLQSNGPAVCNCYEDLNRFPTTFPQVMQLSFSSAQAFSLPSDPAFCEMANERVCGTFKSDFSCCCQEEVETYRKCLFDRVFVPAVPGIQSGCKDSCSWEGIGREETDASGGGGTTAAIVCVLVFLGGCGAGYWIMKRRKDRNANGKGDMAFDKLLNAMNLLRRYISRFADPEKKTVATKPDVEHGSEDSTGSTTGTQEERLHDSKKSSEGQRSKKDRLQQHTKRDLVETWVSQKKNGSCRSLGSNRSLGDYVVEDEDDYEDEYCDELVKRKSSSGRSKSKDKLRKPTHTKGKSLASSSEGHEVMKVRLERLRKDKQELKESLSRNKMEVQQLAGMRDETSVHRRSVLLHDSESMTAKLADLEATKAHYEDQLRAAREQSLELEEAQKDALRLIAKLEFQNKVLVAKLQEEEPVPKGSDSAPRSQERRGRDTGSRQRSRSRNRLDGCGRSKSRSRLDGERSHSRTRLSNQDSGDGNAARPRNRRLQKSGSNRSLRSMEDLLGAHRRDSSRDVRYNSSFSKLPSSRDESFNRSFDKLTDILRNDTDETTNWGNASFQMQDLYKNY
eukprot:scaffold1087_cov136-Cylindrotheca_fusiformis.AAC.1